MKSKKSKSQDKKASIRFISPMLATLVKNPFSSKDWIFETKFDGIRCIACKKGKKISLYSRNKKLLNSSFPEIEKALLKVSKKDFVIDGEIVTFDKRVTSFSKLQPRMHVKKPTAKLIKDIKVNYFVFDVMIYNEKDLKKLPLIERKQILKKKFSYASLIRYSTYKSKDGEKYFNQAQKKGLEGLIAKKKDSIYVSKRSKAWQKFKCVNNQEFVIIGYTEPKGERVGFGAILIGYYKGKELRFAGKVGTGFDREKLNKIIKKLKRIERKNSLLSQKIREKDVHWVAPKIVCEIGFTEWTKDHKLRHPRFLGIRLDKSPKKVIKE